MQVMNDGIGNPRQPHRYSFPFLIVLSDENRGHATGYRIFSGCDNRKHHGSRCNSQYLHLLSI